MGLGCCHHGDAIPSNVLQQPILAQFFCPRAWYDSPLGAAFPLTDAWIVTVALGYMIRREPGKVITLLTIAATVFRFEVALILLFYLLETREIRGHLPRVIASLAASLGKDKRGNAVPLPYSGHCAD